MPVVHYDPTNERYGAWLSGAFVALPFGVDEVTLTSTGNQDNLDINNAALVRFNNASDVTIRGIVAGKPGQVVTIASVGAGNVLLAHQNANSTDVNRLIHPVTVGTTPLAAGKGVATYQYDGTTDRWRLVTHNQGKPIDVAFAAGNYTADGAASWTLQSGDQRQFSYLLVGQTLQVFLALADTTVSGATTSNLYIAIPNSFQANAGYVSQAGGLFGGLSNAVAVNFFPRVIAATPTTIRLNRADGVAWAIGTNNNDSSFQFQFIID